VSALFRNDFFGSLLSFGSRSNEELNDDREEPMARRDEKAASTPEMAQLLRHQFRLAENARFLRRMPAFSANEEMPSHLDELIRQLERSERRVQR
jgi:hypothetical protein